MHLSTIGLVPLVFALGTQAQIFVQTAFNTDGTEGVLRGCYKNIQFNFFDTTAPTNAGTGGYISQNAAATSVEACVQACHTSGKTFALIQGYQSK